MLDNQSRLTRWCYFDVILMPMTLMTELVVRLWWPSCCALCAAPLAPLFPGACPQAPRRARVCRARFFPSLLAVLPLCQLGLWLPCVTGVRVRRWVQAQCYVGGDWLAVVGDTIPEKMLVGCFRGDFEGGRGMGVGSYGVGGGGEGCPS